jgi:hypothetical protein
MYMHTHTQHTAPSRQSNKTQGHKKNPFTHPPHPSTYTHLHTHTHLHTQAQIDYQEKEAAQGEFWDDPDKAREVLSSLTRSKNLLARVKGWERMGGDIETALMLYEEEEEDGGGECVCVCVYVCRMCVCREAAQDFFSLLTLSHTTTTPHPTII